MLDVDPVKYYFEAITGHKIQWRMRKRLCKRYVTNIDKKKIIALVLGYRESMRKRKDPEEN